MRPRAGSLEAIQVPGGYCSPPLLQPAKAETASPEQAAQQGWPYPGALGLIERPALVHKIKEPWRTPDISFRLHVHTHAPVCAPTNRCAHIHTYKNMHTHIGENGKIDAYS